MAIKQKYILKRRYLYIIVFCFTENVNLNVTEFEPTPLVRFPLRVSEKKNILL